MATRCTPLIARQTARVERALRYDERPIDNTLRHTADLPDTPTRDRNIPATAWLEGHIRRYEAKFGGDPERAASATAFTIARAPIPSPTDVRARGKRTIYSGTDRR